jgi:TolB-like protein
LFGGGIGGTTDDDPTIERSVAVLPFVNMSGDSNNEYFSDGITEELLNALAQLPDLRVPGRTSSFAFKDGGLTIRQIADTLDVAHVLEGSVRRQGETVLITAQLIDAQTDRHLWSATFERELTDIFAIQREIATAIAIRIGDR